jgi:hypothetical protein
MGPVGPVFVTIQEKPLRGKALVRFSSEGGGDQRIYLEPVFDTHSQIRLAVT